MARYRFNFWLDCDKDDELLLAETIDELKAERSFTRTIREGIKLVYTLRQRRVDVLEKLFPWIKDHYREKLAQEDSPANREFAAILKQQATILERLAVQQAQPLSLPSPSPMPKPSPELPSAFADNKQATAQTATETRATFAASMGNLFADNDDVFDDDDLSLIEIRKDTRTDATQNFLNSLKNLNA